MLYFQLIILYFFIRIPKITYNRIQLVFCKHDRGQLAYVDEIQSQPPLGILSIASYLQSKCPDYNIEVIDGKSISYDKLVSKMDADLIGFSVWYSNYDNTIKTIIDIKKRNPEVKIAIGGPQCNHLAPLILKNNSSIDFVFTGESEKSFYQLVNKASLNDVSGLYYRNEDKIVCNKILHNIDLEFIPPPNLDLLWPKYSWEKTNNNFAMTAFPVSGIRGCTKKVRCDYCSIPTIGYRTISPKLYWKNVKMLNIKHGIDYFFETGDVFSNQYINQLGKIENIPNIDLRIYLFPNQLTILNIHLLKKIRIKTIFVGIESVVIWKGDHNRDYNSIDMGDIINNIKLYQKNGIKVIPSFILGLKGETKKTIKENSRIILSLLAINGLNEITVSKIVPLPGTKYYSDCINNKNICNQYFNYTNLDLKMSDTIDYTLLSNLYISEFTNIRHQLIDDELSLLTNKIGNGLANWSPN